MSSEGRRRDAPWRRLPAELALAVAAWGVLLLGFGAMIGHPSQNEAADRPIEAHLVEPPVPPSPKPERPRARPRKPAPAVRRPVASPARSRHVTLPQAREPAPPSRPAPELLPSAPPEALPQAMPGAEPERPPGGGASGARVVSRPMPILPPELREQPLSVTAVARFTVAADGQATVILVEPTPDPRVNRWLLAVLAGWTFFPAVQDGRPVAATLDLRVPIEVR